MIRGSGFIPEPSPTLSRCGPGQRVIRATVIPAFAGMTRYRYIGGLADDRIGVTVNQDERIPGSQPLC